MKNKYLFSAISTQAAQPKTTERLRILMLIISLLFLGSAYQAFAQQVVRMAGGPCVGAPQAFTLMGGTASSWTVSPGGIKVSQSGNSVVARWDSPTGGAFVMASLSTGGAVFSPSFNITPSVTPSVTITGPSSFCAGTPVTFSATPVNEGSSPSYNWTVNGNPTGVSTRDFPTSSLNNGDVVVLHMVSNEFCTTSALATSNPITVSVSPQAVVSVSITDPGPICPGTVHAFSASAVNAGSNPIFRWYRNGVEATDNRHAGNIYVGNPLSPNERIMCSVTSSESSCTTGSASSNVVVITAMAQTTPIAIISPPFSSICQGDNITFSASAGGDYTLSNFQWSVNTGSVPSNNSSVFTTNLLSIGSNVVTVTANASGQCLTSTHATGSTQSLTVNARITPAVSLSSTPSLNVCAGESITFTATPINGGSNPVYAWKINESPVGGNGNTLANQVLKNGDVVTVTMTSNALCLAAGPPPTKSVTVSVTPRATITISGASMPLCGGLGGFSALVTNTGPSPVFTWLRNGAAVTDNSPNSPPHVYFPTIPLKDNDKIKCRVSSASNCSSAESNEINVTTIAPTVPIVIISPPYNSFCEGESITFLASAGGSYTLTNFQWKLNSVIVPNNNTATYSPGPLSVGGAGHQIAVSASVSGGCLSKTSVSTTTPTINIIAKPNAAINPTGTKKICSTCTQTIDATPTTSGTTYQWFNGVNIISNETRSSYATSVAGTYSAKVTANGCSKTSGILTLTKNIRPIANAGQDKNLTLPIHSVILNGSGTDADGTIVSYAWTKVSGPTLSAIAGVNTPNLSLSNLLAGTYIFELTVTDDFGEASLPDRVMVTVVYPPNNYNYVKETTVSVPGKTDKAQVTPLAIGAKNISWNYFDGLGRAMQSVQVQASPLGKDIVQPIIYDAYHREKDKYLPYVSAGTDGSYKVDPVKQGGTYTTSVHYQFYQNAVKVDRDLPYAVTVFEPSPLNQVIKQGSPGAAWQPDATNTYASTDRTIKKAYEFNTANEVLLWTYTYPTATYPVGLVNATSASTPTTANYYSPKELSKVKTKDEQGHEIIEYTDKEGKLILKRVQAVTGTPVVNDANYASTYYIYDDEGNLVTVIPPEATNRLATEFYHSAGTDITKDAFLKRWAFRYVYDARKRMIIKQVPGADVIYMVYDKRDRLAMTQDGNLRPAKYWTFTKYDLFNRPIATGMYEADVALLQPDMQARVDNYYASLSTNNGAWFESYIGTAAGNIHGYSNKTFPVESNENNYLTVTYYDNYDFRSLWPTGYAYQNDALSQIVNGVTYNQPATEWAKVKGQITGTKVKILDGNVSNSKAGGYSWLKSISYFDKKYRVIQTISDNIKGGEDRISNLYDFIGKVLKTKTTHIERDVTWKDRVGVLVVGNKLMRSSTVEGGAASVQQLAANQNGWAEFTVSEVITTRYFGLNDTNPDVLGTNIDYAFKLTSSTLTIVENNVTRATVPGALKPGEILRIWREGTAVNYYRNGIKVYPLTLPSPSAPSSSALMVDVAFNTNNATLVGIRSSFSSTSKSVTRALEYDHAGRLVKTTHQIDTQPAIVLTKNDYNELGQAIDKKLHSTNGTSFAQSVDYRYNIRGWLTKMNESDLSGGDSGDPKDYFGMELGYNSDIGVGNTGLFNGNISAMKWSNYLGQSTTKEKSYSYGYDPMNRLVSAAFKERTSSWATAVNSAFSESGYSYDLNGNILGLTRYDQRGSTAAMDVLTYNYGTGAARSNKLLKVSDTGDKFKGFADGTNTGNDYSYDANGSMQNDENKGITSDITYNHLNLPEFIVKGGNSIRNIYDATGRKLAQLTTFAGQLTGVSGPQKQIDYVGEFQYENDVLQNIIHEEGRVVVNSVKTVYKHTGENDADITAVNSTLAMVTQNGTEKYVKATSSGNVARTGMFPIGGTIPVQAGERYLIRIKGYRDKGTAATSSFAYLLVKANGADVDWPGAVIPASLTTANTESYAEQFVTIPAGATQLQAGVVWNTVLAGETMYLNELEIIKITTTTPEYQYHLKDHLGNVRVTFTTKQETENSVATLEAANQASEQSKYLRYQNVKRVQATMFDHTNGSSTGYSQRLNGSVNEKYGLARSLSVMPGDVIKVEAFVKYVDPNQANWNQALTNVMGAISTNAGGIVVDGAQYTTSTSSFAFPGLLSTSGSTGTGPKAYLNWIIFDRDYKYKDGGFLRVSAAAKETGTDVPHERLFKDDISIKEPGYIYIYLSNENESVVEVFFDDFKVDHVKSAVIQMDDYYPFGLTFNSYRRENTVKNNYLYNEGAERADALELGVDATRFRMYDPAMGKWWQVDPLADEDVLVSLTPYNYSFNNPILNNDPEGDCGPLCAGIGAAVGAVVGGAIEAGTQLYEHGEVKDWGAVGGAALQGGITGGVAGLTGGASLLATTTASIGANVAGGALSNVIQGKEITVGSVAKDAVVGVGGAALGKVAGAAINKLSPAVKGQMGEVATQAKYAMKGYVSQGKAVVATGAKTATGKTQVAKYDHAMKNVITGKKLTVESKFNGGALTNNQKAAAAKVTTPGGLIVDKTTSDQVGNAAAGVATGSSSSQIRKEN